MSNVKAITQNLKLKVIFLGTPDFIKPIKDQLAKHLKLVNLPNEADLGVVAAYGKILTKKELEAPKYGFINVHPSLLPKYRGPSPIQQAILNGDKTSGISIIKMDEEVDHGTILYQEELGLSDNDNFDTLSKKMFLRASQILPKVIQDFLQGKIKPRLQRHAIATYCNRLTRESGYFNLPAGPLHRSFNEASRQVSADFLQTLDKMIRAYYPWPGVWTRWKNKIVKFYPEGKIQMEGKKVMPIKDFLNGYPDFPIKNLL